MHCILPDKTCCWEIELALSVVRFSFLCGPLCSCIFDRKKLTIVFMRGHWCIARETLMQRSNKNLERYFYLVAYSIQSGRRRQCINITRVHGNNTSPVFKRRSLLHRCLKSDCGCTLAVLWSYCTDVVADSQCDCGCSACATLFNVYPEVAWDAWLMLKILRHH